jgi:hypothetical protein
MFERSTLRALVEHKLDKEIREFVASHEQGFRENGIDPEEYPDFIWMLIAEAAAAYFVKKLARKQASES